MCGSQWVVRWPQSGAAASALAAGNMPPHSFCWLRRGQMCRHPEKLRVPPPRRLKETETSAAALAGCTPCGPVMWQTVPSRNSRAPHHVLGAAYICVAGDNAAASILLLLAGERRGGGCSAPSHLSELQRKMPPRRGSQFHCEWVIFACDYAHTELWGSECQVQYEKKIEASSQLLCVPCNLHGLPREI
ncbi:hypothetical protein TraAM80_10425 [Trypanosoma rangeli]|uniref:Uncharacterized protein n=1 Tax=Trypanosoma rangeli TaxID=5698 RepID=A0A3R7MTK8_TRYRA|nr:uncharacterized protein TraAM80_10425 [Trypanosoma rangeli]RNE95052.1 hypothetical protein TraAM80_10425 [Trypanosoma rangeli]|eukprot:RNE95052.1 hypothetical protein TraAM80_10425 [Trypanosoma rangeli]